jgi:hypothetical protein
MQDQVSLAKFVCTSRRQFPAPAREVCVRDDGEPDFSTSRVNYEETVKGSLTARKVRLGFIAARRRTAWTYLPRGR